MKFYNYLIVILPFVILCSCETDIRTEGIEGTVLCDRSNIEVTETDNIVLTNTTETVFWSGNYSENIVRIHFTKKLNNHGAAETLNFVFNKVDNCLQIDRGYEFYNGGISDINSITQVYILEAYIKDWEIDKKLTGQITYRDHHDKLIKKLNFWIEFKLDDYEVKDPNYNYFSDCFTSKLPIEIDLDNDGTIDYSILAEEIIDFANSPNFVFNTIKLVSKDETINEILSPRGVSIPFPVIFEPPFSTENTRGYAANKFKSADVKNALDVFYEFEPPYESYNFFLQNNLTYKKEFDNDKNDYYAVKLIRNNESYYGWIKIDFNALECKVFVLDTFLNPNPNEHISVD